MSPPGERIAARQAQPRTPLIIFSHTDPTLPSLNHSHYMSSSFQGHVTRQTKNTILIKALGSSCCSVPEHVGHLGIKGALALSHHRSMVTTTLSLHVVDVAARTTHQVLPACHATLLNYRMALESAKPPVPPISSRSFRPQLRSYLPGRVPTHHLNSLKDCWLIDTVKVSNA